MQTAQRPGQPGVIAGLAQAPHRYQSAQAVRLLLRWLWLHGVSGERAFTEVLRFHSSLSLAFPAGEIEELYLEVEEGAAPGAPPHRIRITPTFIGLLGAHGALPLHETQRLAALPPGEAEASTRAFLDMFSGRLVALFHQAWGKHRLEYTLDTAGRDSQLPLLLALGGVSHLACGAEQQTAAYYAGLLRTRPVCAQTIGRVLAGHFGMPVKLHQFSGCWDYLPKERISTLGVTEPKLGHGAVLGRRIWRQDRQVQLDIGPLDAETLERFLPHSEGAAALRRMLRLMGVPSMRYEVHLIHSPASIGKVILGGKGPKRRLGWDTFLPDRDGKVTRPEVRYVLEP